MLDFITWEVCWGLQMGSGIQGVSVPGQENKVIWFADVAGSTELYERLGDTTGRLCIVESLLRLEKSVGAFQGYVVEIVGDEVMACFDSPEQAISAACDAQRSFQAPLINGHFVGVRIGLHFGPVGMEDKRPYGDSVNVAARMAQLAEAGKIICTSETCEGLTLPGVQIRPFQEAQVKGKSEPIPTSEVVWETDEMTSFFVPQDKAAGANKSRVVELGCGGEHYQVGEGVSPFQIGRSEECHLTVDASTASRKHATIEHRWGDVFLIDSSTNGTYVTFSDTMDGQGQEERIHRRELRLVGKGIISLGCPHSSDPANGIEFEVK